MFPASTSYDPQTLDVLRCAFDEAWLDVQRMLGQRLLDPNCLRALLARRIIAAADTGERDPRRLKLLAMGAIDA